MKLRLATRRRQHPNVLRQKGVHCQGELAHRDFEFWPRNLNVRDHTQGMHARIGATGAVKARSGREQVGEGFFDFLLHPDAGLLHLPAGVVGAVVGDGQFDFNFVHARSHGKV